MLRDSRTKTPRKAPERGQGSGGSSVRGGERRIVTALCYDLVGSTDLMHVMDIEDYQELMSAFQFASKQEIASRSGVMQHEAGDGGVALFPIELEARDAASLAIRAGLGIVEACKRVGREAGQDDLQVRVGIATSVALVREASREGWAQEPVTGAALAMAARLQAIAAPSSVLVCEETRHLAGRSYSFVFEGSKELKGFTTPEKVWRALGHKVGIDRFYAFGRLGGPLINRENELNTIGRIWDGVLAGQGSVVLIEGDAGIGKSRLLREIRRRTRGRRSKLLFFQCLPGGFRSTLHPLLNNLPGSVSGGGQMGPTAAAVAALFERNGIRDAEVVDVFAYLLGAQGSRQPSSKDPKAIRERAHRALLRALEAMCRSGPAVVAVEDIHWIDPTSQDLLGEAARIIGQFPILLVTTSRPASASEWLDIASPTRLPLRPLDPDETRLAIKAKWPEHRLDLLPDLFDATERISGGVPLFIEEICQWVSQNVEPDTMRLSESANPTHVSAFESILASRLQQLGTAREVARAAAVAGTQVTLPLLRALLPDFGKSALANAADTLCETGFLTRIRLPGRTAYGFRHTLIQETIYKSVLRKQRQVLHRRLFTTVNQNRGIAAWIDTGALAEHAERAGLLEEAAPLFITAGKESSSRSAMIEAKQFLEHALDLCGQLGESDTAEPLKLSAFTALGPILIGAVGLSSEPARRLYEDAVEIARQRPLSEQSQWFPIYWGWWLTGSNFRVMHDRALEVRSMLSKANEPEIQLQVNHCIWAIDFNLGRHRETQEAIKAGLALYDEKRAKESRTEFGGHDAKVCGLGQLALSLWLTGRTKASDAALSRMIAFADRIAHAHSKAHSLDTEAVSAFYRDDFEGLTRISLRMADFAQRHKMQSLSGLSNLFGGWAEAHRTSLASGHALFQSGLSQLRELGAVADLPIYLCMHATLLGLAGRIEPAINVVNEAIGKGEETGHAYWLAELHRCRAILLARTGERKEVVAADLRCAIEIAESQGATALLRRARKSTRELGIVIRH
ncbi:ATP-binding protein [Sinorhizobium medicae]|uniref:Guanylate cyclase domain-containing protein n=1 Tax=Sinorhizobium medicae TaxID=110321 RepID=A0A508WV39_9HYPH|nr:AAA family ATPase [Sinorhizobium medicae]MDX0424410.1 AAA family ATPase [Sinorhizobium medicae]MDX0522921.1 AAA family ATPase [Sinorhizobium medicae]MDX0547647.1 AAA family ATPase [Sinorhizobium medicae]MDX0635277.1 AAA family ATPase [Sinorhizobium medicae]MDX0715041.1 AAA family ATPase [Sinorhizobium medicae]